MTAKEFFETVEKMRHAQKTYFRSRSLRYLQESKQLEKAVDDEIQRVHDALNGDYKMNNLFGDENK